MLNMYLIRGLPGSGKTTLAETLSGVFSVAADDFFYRHGLPDNGAMPFFIRNSGWEYKYEAAAIPDAHEWCRAWVERWARDKEPSISVHNTFCQSWEVWPYLAIAKANGYRVTIITVDGGHGARSLHGVSEETLIRMAERFEPSMPRWGGT